MNVPTTEEILAAYKSVASVPKEGIPPTTDEILSEMFHAWQKSEERRVREKIYNEIEKAVPPPSEVEANSVKTALEMSIKEAVRQGMYIAQRIVRNCNADITSD